MGQLYEPGTIASKPPKRAPITRSPEIRNEVSELWVRCPYWDHHVEASYQDWLSSIDLSDPWSILLGSLKAGLAIGIRQHGESYCVTLSDGDRKLRGLPCLLSGWSDSADDAVLVAWFKHSQQLAANWDNGGQEKTKFKRH
jgi:hypothetical protein